MRRGLACSFAALLAASPAVAQSTLNRAGLSQQSGISLGSNNQNKLTAAGVQTILNLVIGNTANLNDANIFTGSNDFSGGTMKLPGAAVGGTAFTATGTPASRSAAARAADTINPRDYGAFGDGASHTVSATLGINTLAGLATYSADGGATHPYSFINQYPYGVLFNLIPEVDAAAGATGLVFQSTSKLGIQVPVTSPALINASSLFVGDLAVTPQQALSFTGSVSSGVLTVASNITGGQIVVGQYLSTGGRITGFLTGVGGVGTYSTSAPNTSSTTIAAWQIQIANGTGLAGPGVANGTTVTVSGGAYPVYNPLALSANTTAAIAMLQYVTAYVTVAAGSYVIPILSASMQQGDVLTDTGGCIAAGTQVEYVNRTAGWAIVSKPTQADCPAQDIVTSQASWLSHVSAGMQLQGPLGTMGAGLTVQSVNLSTGTVLLAGGSLAGPIAADRLILNNQPSTTLASPVTAGASSITVASATGFPTSGNFTIQLLNGSLQNNNPGSGVEIDQVTAGQGTATWTISRPSSAQAFPAGAVVSWPQESQQVTFYRPYSDAEAAAFEMDGLGIQASVNKTQAAPTGGGVALPSNSQWRLSGPIILPLQNQYGNGQKPVGLGGPTDSPSSAWLEPVADFGPDEAAISCADPSAKASNGRGVFSRLTGVIWCNGDLHDVRITPANSYALTYGLRPTWGGTPVAMDGLKWGTRLNLNRDLIDGFRWGAHATLDHTRTQDSQFYSNFGGVRMDDVTGSEYGDLVFDRFYTQGNSFAGLVVSPNAFWSGIMNKPYLSSAPYAIYCEGGTASTSCVQQATIENTNSENTSCAYMQDGGIQDGFVGLGGIRAIVETVEIGAFHYGPVAAFNSIPPVWGCHWNAFYDMGQIVSLRIENVQDGEFPQIAGAYGYLARTSRVNGFGLAGKGGLVVEGNGVYDMIQRAQQFGQNVVASPGGFPLGGLWYTGGWNLIKFIGPGFVAMEVPFYDAGASSLPLGALTEWSTTTLDSNMTIERAGKTANAAFAGVSLQAWPFAPQSQNIAPVIAVGGSNVPFLTTGSATVGEMVVPDGVNLGQAVSTSTAYGTNPAVGIIQAAGAAGVNYGRLMMGPQ